jgi:hypothetical protein
MIRNSQCAAFLLSGLLAASAALAQPQKRTSSFVIDPSKPYVYLAFDHVGKREPFSQDEPDRGLWIRLVNNCRLPVTLVISGPGQDDPDIATDDEIVTHYPGGLGQGLRAGGSPPSEAPTESIPPHGYSHGDVASTTAVEPGTSLLLSFPANHVGPTWELQIKFYLNFPGHAFYGYGPYSVVSFGLDDVPKKFRDAVGD